MVTNISGDASKNTNNFLYPTYLFRKKLALMMLRRHLAGRSNFLEIGAGRGDFSRTLLNHVKSGEIIEFSDDAAEFLKHNLAESGIKIIKADFSNYNFTDKYSLIAMFEVLEHLKDDQAAIKKINNILEDKGLFILSVPAKMKRWSMTDKIGGHYRRYEKNHLIKLLNDNNFQIIDFASYGFPLLNAVCFFRNMFFKLNFKKINVYQTKEKSSEYSGLGFIDFFYFKRIIAVVIKIFFSERLINLYVKTLKPFNRLDWGDGYLCLAIKK